MIKSNTKTHEKSPGFIQRLEAVAKKTAGSYVTVGVHKGEGNYKDEGGQDVDVALVALWNEFGTVNAPERSFIRSTLAENSGLIATWRIEVLTAMATKKMPLDKALNIIGFRLQQLIVAKIKSNVPPPNAPATVKAKEAQGMGDRTLIATTLLLRSIKWRVVIPAGVGESEEGAAPAHHGHE